MHDGKLQNKIDHNYFNIIPHEEHQARMTWEGLKKHTSDMKKPTLFKSMIQFPDEVSQKSFYSVETQEKLSWHERKDNKGVSYQREGSTVMTYDHVSGEFDTAERFLEDIFDHKKNVYTYLGLGGSGYRDLYSGKWGAIIHDHLMKKVVRPDWMQIPQWQFTGQCFMGHSDTSFGELSGGYPGSDWHMFLTVNLFAMVSGTKRWFVSPPKDEDMENHSNLMYDGGGRILSMGDTVDNFDYVHLEKGDVLFIPAYEWHKVLNDEGLSCGLALRIIDTDYIKTLNYENRFKKFVGNVECAGLVTTEDDVRDIYSYFLKEEYIGADSELDWTIVHMQLIKHLLTSVKYTVNDPRRMKHILNFIEQFYFQKFIELHLMNKKKQNS